MKVAVFPSDDGGCGWYRLRWPAEHAARHGHNLVVDPDDMAYYRHRDTGRPVDLDLDAEVVVVQRTTRDIAVGFVAMCKAKGKRVVVDVDDDLDSLHDGHPYLAAVHSDGRHPDNLHRVCDLADVVTVTTPALADRYGGDKAVVLPNLVPERYLKVKPRRKGPPRVGWTGRPISHIGDASVMGGTVGPVVAAAGAKFCAWGQSAERTFAECNVPTGARVTVPARPLRSGYPESVAELTVGLVPLLDTPFNAAKSWLKGIEYAALGVPFVASPTPEYRKLHDLGAGWLASTPDEWAEMVARLLDDDDLRRVVAEDGRRAVEGLTYEAHGHRWWDAWTAMPGTDDESATVMGVPGDHPPRHLAAAL